jgi:hypothetical protein
MKLTKWEIRVDLSDRLKREVQALSMLVYGKD